MPPAVLPAGAYNPAFKTLMVLCGIAALFAVVVVLVTAAEPLTEIGKVVCTSFGHVPTAM